MVGSILEMKDYIDNEGFLKITGRVKDLFKTSKGKCSSISNRNEISENQILNRFA